MAAPLAHVRAVLFDLDDTLLDTYSARTRAIASAFADAGVTEPRADAFMERYNGFGFDSVLLEVERAHGGDLGLMEAYRRAYALREASQVRAFEGIAEMLELLAGAERRLGVVTSKAGYRNFEGARLGATYELEVSGLLRYFDVVVSADDVTRLKPDAEPVERALKNLACAPTDAVMVGDSTSDFGAGRSAGAWVCHARWGGRSPGPEFEGAEPHYAVDTPGQLAALLGAGGR